MKKNLFFLLLIFLIFSCKKDENELKFSKNVVLTSYMKSLSPIDTLHPYKGDYYIHVSLKNQGSSESKEITYSKANKTIASCSDQSIDNSVLGRGWSLKDTATQEELEISFYYCPKTDTIFQICYADYRFANPWRNMTGANIKYFRPVESRPNTYYLYLGINSNNTFFKITYIGKDRINGSFQTTLEECCGEKTIYIVSGDFSLPRIYSFKYIF